MSSRRNDVSIPFSIGFLDISNRWGLEANNIAWSGHHEFPYWPNYSFTTSGWPDEMPVAKYSWPRFCGLNTHNTARNLTITCYTVFSCLQGLWKICSRYYKLNFGKLQFQFQVLYHLYYDCEAWCYFKPASTCSKSKKITFTAEETKLLPFDGFYGTLVLRCNANTIHTKGIWLSGNRENITITSMYSDVRCHVTCSTMTPMICLDVLSGLLILN